ncbi:MAG: HEAT repeat domain-containing protein, partial [Bacteroidales bacterium]|jgi:hypothetical protein|nr:HEAT repeat domain-containing protein [Bacteroidales bacterium]HPG33251.1 HEAT repeat domain-containing protein [Lentimicrobium sp.]
MKRKLFIAGSGLLGLIMLGFLTIYIWIDIDVKKNIKIAQERYPGKADDALIAFLLDTTNSPQNRSSVAIWTLGQIQSEKAIPVLEDLYKNDPEGKTCYGKHDSVLCQHEIYKALNASKSNWWPLHSRLNK